MSNLTYLFSKKIKLLNKKLNLKFKININFLQQKHEFNNGDDESKTTNADDASIKYVDVGLIIGGVCVGRRSPKRF